jgi:pimaricinolide synthase PimS1
VSDEARLRRYLEKVTRDLRDANRRLALAEGRRREPIAIVGMSCRYPGGVGSPVQLWQLVEQGRDAISGFPADRGWDLQRLHGSGPGACSARGGGFLDDVAGFDPDFFGISPREAPAIDPQQRLLLEASWEALEHGGLDPRSLRGAPVGVFAGVMSQEYAVPEYGIAPGMTTSISSGRVAYALGLEGPAVTVDTACSSSLVAIHLAAGALREGECRLALAGGATVLCTPNPLILFGRQGGLSPDGRCRSFAEAANGVGWSEGVGLLVLERLADAEANGHRVLATIRGSAVNQDGASNGLTAPNGPSQERVIRQALAAARLAPQEVDAVEAHGTGTTLGDPIEARALLATYGQDREKPLRLGSIKSNFGHTQAAAGIAGVIKMVMAMRKGVLPRTLHVDRPSDKVEWSAGAVELLTEAAPWEAEGRPRRAAVSSFGISGTNAHVILEEAPPAEAAGAAVAEGGAEAGGAGLRLLPAGRQPLVLSARSQPTLRETAARLAAQLRESPDLDLADVAHSLARTRCRFEQRAVLATGDRDGAIAALDSLARGEQSPAVATGSARGERRPVFLFGGQGAQWAGMGLELIEASPRFAESMRACEEALAPHVEWSLDEVLRDAGGEWLERLDVVQPALFAVMVSLADLWRGCGVEPAAVVGHSQGEIAAARVAGALSLEDAARVVALRARAMAKIAGKGGMLWVSLPLEQLRERLQPEAGRLALAAINGPASQVVSGEPEALAELAEACRAEGFQAREVAVDYAAHSAQIDALEDELIDAFAPISPRTGDVPFHSTVSNEVLDTAELGPGYWFRNLRQTVLFEPALRSLLEQGHRAFVEIAPHPVLAYGAEETFESAQLGGQATVLGALRRDDGGAGRFALCLAEAHAHGCPLDWEALFEGSAPRVVPLPTYPFQRQRYWPSSSSAGSDPRALGQAPVDDPMLSAALSLPSGQLLLTGRISPDSHPWLADHAVSGVPVLPFAALLELAISAADAIGCETVAGLATQSPLFLGDGATQLRMVVEPADESGARALAIHSRPEPEADEDGEGGPWTLNAQGALGQPDPAALEPPAAWPPPGAESLDLDGVHDGLAERGIEWGPAFQGLTAAWRDGDGVYAELTLADQLAEGAAHSGLHPALLQPALQLASLYGGGEATGPELPDRLELASLQGGGGSTLRLWASPADEGGVSVGLGDGDGGVLGSVYRLRGNAIEAEQLRAATEAVGPLLRLEWVEPSTAAPAQAPAPIAVLGDLELDGLAVERYPDLSDLLDSASPTVPEIVLVECGPSAAGALPGTAHASAAEALSLLQGWVADERLAESRLVFVTRGAVAVEAGEDPDLAASPLWGLLRSIQAEHPDSLALLDLDRSERSPGSLAGALGASAEEPQLAIREGRVLAPRLAPVASTELPQPAPDLDSERTVLLVGGGAGGLAGLVAEHLAERGARHLLLACSDQEASDAAELAIELAQRGCELRVEACDAADRGQLEALIESIPSGRPLGAVVHAVRVLDDGVLESLDPERLERVMRPKVDAAWNLHQLTERLELSEFLLFSSSVATLGAAAQASYGAANAFLEALVAHRRARGLPASAIAWGWTDPGGDGDGLGDLERARLARAGLVATPPPRIHELLDLARAADEPFLAAFELDPAALRAAAREGSMPSVLKGLVRVLARPRRREKLLAERLASVPEGERPALALEVVRGHIAAVLGHSSAEDVDPERPFQELGFDSLSAVELRNRLTASTGTRLPPTLAFDYPSPAALAGYLADRCEEGGGASPEEEVESALAGLESALAALGEDQGTRGRVGMRLRAALAGLTGGDVVAPEVVADDIAAMSDDEVFALIDEEMADE